MLCIGFERVGLGERHAVELLLLLNRAGRLAALPLVPSGHDGHTVHEHEAFQRRQPIKFLVRLE